MSCWGGWDTWELGQKEDIVDDALLVGGRFGGCMFSG